MTLAQRNFLTLHARNIVYQHQWYFCETQLRAQTGTKTATIWRDELDDLVNRGLMLRGAGCADVTITTDGRELVR